jgi:hypothetical protein
MWYFCQIKTHISSSLKKGNMGRIEEVRGLGVFTSTDFGDI